MKRVLVVLVAGLFAGVIAASHAKLPAAAGEERRREEGEADKAAAAKAKDADDLGKAQDRVVAHYKKNKGGSLDGTFQGPQEVS